LTVGSLTGGGIPGLLRTDQGLGLRRGLIAALRMTHIPGARALDRRLLVVQLALVGGLPLLPGTGPPLLLRTLQCLAQALHLLGVAPGQPVIAHVKARSGFTHALVPLHFLLTPLGRTILVRGFGLEQVGAELPDALVLLGLLPLAGRAHELLSFLLLAGIDGGVARGRLGLLGGPAGGQLGLFALPLQVGQDAVDLLDLGDGVGLLGLHVRCLGVELARLHVGLRGQGGIGGHDTVLILPVAFALRLPQAVLLLTGPAQGIGLLLGRATGGLVGFTGSRLTSRQFGIDLGDPVLRMTLVRLHLQRLAVPGTGALQLIGIVGGIGLCDHLAVAGFEGFGVGLALAFQFGLASGLGGQAVGNGLLAQPLGLLL